MSPLHILHLSLPPSLSLLRPSHLTVLASSLHQFHMQAPFREAPRFGLLLTWVSVGGASRWRIFLRRQPVLAWGQKKKKKEEYEQNDWRQP